MTRPDRPTVVVAWSSNREPACRSDQDRNERDFDMLIVSVSLGAPATFLWGGRTRTERPRKFLLEHGDVLVWGGPACLHIHGVDKRRTHSHEFTGNARFNVTFRRVR